MLQKNRLPADSMPETATWRLRFNETHDDLMSLMACSNRRHGERSSVSLSQIPLLLCLCSLCWLTPGNWKGKKGCYVAMHSVDTHWCLASVPLSMRAEKHTYKDFFLYLKWLFYEWILTRTSVNFLETEVKTFSDPANLLQCQLIIGVQLRHPENLPQVLYEHQWRPFQNYI